ncbi:unnamed protein product [Closterium sp. NIES-54]
MQALRRMAQDYLAIPATSASSERVFSLGRNLISWKWHRLASQRTRSVMILRSWYSSHPGQRIGEGRRPRGVAPPKFAIEGVGAEEDDEEEEEGVEADDRAGGEDAVVGSSKVPPSSEAGRVYLSDWVINPQALLYQQFQAALLLLAILIGIIEPFNVAFLHTDNVLTPVNAFIYCTDTRPFDAAHPQHMKCVHSCQRLYLFPPFAPPHPMPQQVFVSRGTCSSLRLNARRTSSHVPRPASPQVFLSDVLLSFFVPEFRMGEWKTSLASIAVE